MDRAAFFKEVRSSMFGGRLFKTQVQGMEAILAEAERRGTFRGHLSYMLATAYKETAKAMKPNTENLNYTTVARIRQVWPSRFPNTASAQPYVSNPKGLANKVYNGRMGNRMGSDDGWTYRGRGLPHLTGRENYMRASGIIGTDLVKDPDRALEIDIAVKVLFDGMGRGWFTGAKLSDYINKTKTDFYNARRIVNSLDAATEIAGFAKRFESALKVSGYVGEALEPPKLPEPVETKPLPAPKGPAGSPPVTGPAPAAKPTNIGAIIIGVILAALAILAAFLKGG